MNSFDKFFYRFFPTPSFFGTSSFGLDIGDESLKFLELVNTKNGLRVGRYGEYAILPGVIELGRIKNSKSIEEILLKLRNEIGLRSARVSLPETQVYLFRLRLEKLGLVNIRESIEFALEEHVPLQASGAIFDYEIIYEDTQSIELQVATIPKNVIESYLSIFQI